MININDIIANLNLIEKYALEGKTVKQTSYKILENNKELNTSPEKLEKKIRNFLYDSGTNWKSISKFGLPENLKSLIKNDTINNDVIEIPLKLSENENFPKIIYNFIDTYLRFSYNYDKIIEILQSELSLLSRQSKIFFDKGYEEQNINYYNKSKELQLKSNEINSLLNTLSIIFKLDGNIERINPKVTINLYEGLELIKHIL